MLKLKFNPGRFLHTIVQKHLAHKAEECTMLWQRQGTFKGSQCQMGLRAGGRRIGAHTLALYLANQPQPWGKRN